MHNIKKIYAKIMAKGGELDRLTRELEAAYNPPEVDIILLKDVGGFFRPMEGTEGEN